MRGRATSDLHLSERTSRYVFNALRELRNDAADRGGDTVLVGDILDQSENVHMPTYNQLRDELNAFPNFVFVLAGNHDQYRGYRNALEGLAGGNVIVISEPEWTSMGLMVPYTPESEFWNTVEKHLKDRPSSMDCPNVWWTHQGWKGAYLNNMVKDKGGLTPARIDADVVITGHYHMPQNIGPIIYCGSPYQTTFAEEGQVKSWLRFDDNSLVPTRVPYEHVEAPRHWTVHWAPGSPPQMPAGYIAGDKVRVVTKASKSEVKQERQALKDAGFEGVPVLSRPDAVGREDIDINLEPLDAVEQYMTFKHGPNDGANPVQLMEWANEAGLWD